MYYVCTGFGVLGYMHVPAWLAVMTLYLLGWLFSLTGVCLDIQSCSVEPLPERDTMRRFDGKNVAESIVRYYRLHTYVITVSGKMYRTVTSESIEIDLQVVCAYLCSNSLSLFMLSNTYLVRELALSVE